MTQNEFKTMFVKLIAWGWSGEYADELNAKANNPAQLSKIFSRARLVAYRNCISIHDALNHLISSGKLGNI